MKKNRVILLYVLLIIGFSFVIFKLAKINIIDGEKLREDILNEKKHEAIIKNERGMVLDSEGFKLAYNMNCYKISIPKPLDIESFLLNEIINEMSIVLNIDKQEILDKFDNNKTVVITENATKEQKEKISKKYYPYLWIDNIQTRVYPNLSLASDIIGLTSNCENELNGIYGIEKHYNDELTGTDGYVITQSDKYNRELVYSERIQKEVENGNNIYLTINAVLQHYLEEKIEQGFEKHTPKSVHAIVMDVNTGKIKAMASYPKFNPNNGDIIGVELEEDMDIDKKREIIYSVWRNDVVSSVFEVGSTIKLLTAAIALETNVATPDTLFDEGNSITLYDKTIKCWYYPRSHGVETLKEAVVNSCNPVFVKLGSLIGKEKFYKYYKDFGMTEITEIDLPNEAKPIVYDYDNINGVELATMTYGHGVAHTPIQVATAVSAIVNGGYLLKPHIVEKIEDEDNNILYQANNSVRKQVISNITSMQMRDIIKSVADSNDELFGNYSEYDIGIKTGTAIKSENGSYSEDAVLSSCIAIAPMDKPKILVYILVDEPKDVFYGSKVAAPIARDVMVDVLDYLDIKKDVNSTSYIKVPNIINMSIKEATELVGEDFNIRASYDKVYSEDFIITNQYPKAGLSKQKGSTILVEVKNEN